jgi:TPR repeat protein
MTQRKRLQIGAAVTLATIMALLSFAPVTAGPLEDAVAAYVRGDNETAVRVLRPLAEQGDARAQYHLGTRYFTGSGVPQDYAEALKWFRLSADQGNPDGHSQKATAERLELAGGAVVLCLNTSVRFGHRKLKEQCMVGQDSALKEPEYRGHIISTRCSAHRAAARLRLPTHRGLPGNRRWLLLSDAGSEGDIAGSSDRAGPNGRGNQSISPRFSSLYHQ